MNRQSEGGFYMKVEVNKRRGGRFIAKELLRELTDLLQEVANERETASEGLGGYPTRNAKGATELMKKMGIRRKKPPWLS